MYVFRKLGLVDSKIHRYDKKYDGDTNWWVWATLSYRNSFDYYLGFISTPLFSLPLISMQFPKHVTSMSPLYSFAQAPPTQKSFPHPPVVDCKEDLNPLPLLSPHPLWYDFAVNSLNRQNRCQHPTSVTCLRQEKEALCVSACSLESPWECTQAGQLVTEGWETTLSKVKFSQTSKPKPS